MIGYILGSMLLIIISGIMIYIFNKMGEIVVCSECGEIMTPVGGWKKWECDCGNTIDKSHTRS